MHVCIWVCLAYEFPRGFSRVLSPPPPNRSLRRIVREDGGGGGSRITIYKLQNDKRCGNIRIEDGRKWLFSPLRTKLKTFFSPGRPPVTDFTPPPRGLLYTERLLITLFMPGDRTVERLTLPTCPRRRRHRRSPCGIVSRPKAVLYAVNLLKFNSPPPPPNNRQRFINGIHSRWQSTRARTVPPPHDAGVVGGGEEKEGK